MANNPLVTAMMITGRHSARYALARVAIECFLQQTYDNKELVIVNHGDLSLACPYDHVREIRVKKGENDTLGDLRNIALDNAKGDLIMVWDDDDWYHPLRMEVQVNAYELDAAVLLKNQIRFNLLNRCGFSFHSQTGIPGTMLYPRDIPFRYLSIERNEDTVLKVMFPHHVVIDNDPLLYIRFFHGLNTFGARHIMRHLADPAVRERLELDEQQGALVREIANKYPRPDGACADLG